MPSSKGPTTCLRGALLSWQSFLKRRHTGLRRYLLRLAAAADKLIVLCDAEFHCHSYIYCGRSLQLPEDQYPLHSGISLEH